MAGLGLRVRPALWHLQATNPPLSLFKHVVDQPFGFIINVPSIHQ